MLTHADLLPAAFACSGGARVASASGVLPDRITTAALVEFALGANTNYPGPCFDADGNIWHIITASPTYLRCYSLATGAEVVAKRVTLGVNCYSVTRSDSGRLIVGGVGKIYEVDPATSTIVSTVTLAGGVTAFRAVRVPGVVGKYWIITTSAFTGGSCAEYGGDGNATGRTLNAISSTMATLHTHPSFPGYLWVWRGSGDARAYKVAESDLSVAVTYTASTPAYGLAGEQRSPWSGCVDASGRLYTWMGTGYCVDRFTAAGAVDRRVLHHDARRHVPTIVWDAGCGHGQFCHLSDGDTWLAWMAATTGATSRFNAIRAQCVGNQIAYASLTPSAGITVEHISVKGNLRNARSTSTDDRATKFYYSLDGGSTLVAFEPGDVTIAVAQGQTLKIYVYFNLLGLPPDEDPYVASVRVDYDDPTVVGPSYADPTAPTTLAAIRNALKAQLVGLTPSTRPDVRFHEAPASTRWGEWVAANKGSQSYRIFSVERDPDSQTEELPLCSPSARYVEDVLLLRVAYPLTPGLYGAAGWQGLEDVLEADADQLSGRAENCQYYLAGQVQTVAEEHTVADEDGVAVLTIRLRCRYYKTRKA